MGRDRDATFCPPIGPALVDSTRLSLLCRAAIMDRFFSWRRDAGIVDAGHSHTLIEKSQIDLARLTRLPACVDECFSGLLLPLVASNADPCPRGRNDRQCPPVFDIIHTGWRRNLATKIGGLRPRRAFDDDWLCNLSDHASAHQNGGCECRQSRSPCNYVSGCSAHEYLQMEVWCQLAAESGRTPRSGKALVHLEEREAAGRHPTTVGPTNAKVAADSRRLRTQYVACGRTRDLRSTSRG